MVKWKIICRSKDQDGLGIINLSNFNLALKCKYLWNLLGSTQKLKWPNLVLNRYYTLNNLGSLLNLASNGSSLFLRELKKCFPVVNMISSFSIHNGKNIIFWENKWLRDRALKYVWPFLYSLTRKKKCSAESLLLNYADRQLNIFSVNNDSLLAFHSSDELHDFMECIEALQLQLGVDNIEWFLTPNKIFSVKSCYNFLNDGGLRSKFSVDIWKAAVPCKIKIFV